MKVSKYILFGILCAGGIVLSVSRYGVDVTAEHILLIIMTILLLAHILFGEYFVSRKLKNIKHTEPHKLTFFLINLAGILAIVSAIYFIFEPIYWLTSISLLFVSGIVFHIVSKKVTTSVELQEFCNYKIFIEAYGTLLSLFSIFFLLRFPSLFVYWALGGVFMILHLNGLIFFKKRLYNFNFIPVHLPPKPLVSIVVIMYNEEAFITKTLEHIKQQTYKNYEVILVDDQSSDNTVMVAKQYLNKLPLTIVKRNHSGPAHSRNHGASLARGKLILFLDADTHISPNFIQQAVSKMRKQHLSMAAPDFTHDSSRFLDRLVGSIYGTWLKMVQFHNPRAVGFCLLVLKEVHDRICFDGQVLIAEDFDYVRRASRIGKFRIIKGAQAITSWRRFRKENAVLLILKYFIVELYRQNIGEVRKKIVSYEFGNYGKSDSADKR